MPSLDELLNSGRPVLLDGATGTELNRRGVDTSLPLWSARALIAAPEVLRQIHHEYVAAGAQIITADTFRTHRRNLAAAGLDHRAGELTRWAVEIAREAAAGRALVAGSLAPLEDCYRPDLVPDDAALAAEHGEAAAHLADAGVDLILVETHNTIREACAASRAAAGTGLPFFVGFVCGRDARLLSGEDLAEAIRAVLPLEPKALLVNCVPTPAVPCLLKTLRSAAAGLPIGVYANIGYADPQQGWINTDAEDPAAYAAYARSWLAEGAALIGGCCGTTPEHIRRLREEIVGWSE